MAVRPHAARARAAGGGRAPRAGHRRRGAGARDLLSTAAVARRAASLDDGELLRLLTVRSAEVARMPVGGFDPGAPADFVATASLPALLAGDRLAIALVVVRGEPVFGEAALLEAAGRPAHRVRLDGEERSLAAATGQRLASLLRRYPAARRAAWLASVTL